MSLSSKGAAAGVFLGALLWGGWAEAQTEARPIKLYKRSDYRTSKWVMDLPPEYYKLGQSRRQEASSVRVAPGWVGILYGWKDNWQDSPRVVIEGNVPWLGAAPHYFDDRTKGTRAVRRDDNVDASRIGFAGSTTTYDANGFRNLLSASGRTLVGGDAFEPQSTALQAGQCTVVYANADAGDASADVGALVCAVELADGLTLEMSAVYGGCDLAERGSGGSCEFGVFTTTLQYENHGVVSSVTVSGPSGEFCSEVSTDRMCYTAGLDLASVGVEIGDNRGNSVGASVGVGVGAGAGANYEDGVLSAEFDLKIIAGGSISFSIGVEEDAKVMIALGKTAYAKIDGDLIAASNRVVNAGYAVGDAVAVSGQVIVSVVENGEQAVKFFTRGATGALGSFAGAVDKGLSSIEDFGNDLGNALNPGNWF